MNNQDYSKKEDKKLDKEITKAQQDVGSRSESKPIDFGKDMKSDEQLIREDKLVSELIDKFKTWEMWRKPFENKWDQIYRLYFNNDSEVKLPTRAKIFIPMVFRIIESGVPIIVNTIFSSESIFDVIPTHPEDQDMADIIKLLLSYQMGQADFFLKFLDFSKQLCLYGTSYFKVYWKVRRAWVWTREPIREPVSILGVPLGTRIVGWKEKKEYKVVERRPEIDMVDILDVFPDPDASNEKNGEGIFIRTWVSLDEVRELGAGKYPVYANVESEKLKSSADDTSFGISRQTRYSTRGTSNVHANRSKNVEILEYWGLYDVDGDGIREEAYIVIANRKVLFKARGNPFHHQKRPLIRCNLFTVPLEWYGIGLIEPVIGNQHELNTLRRQRLDNINMILNRMWKVKDTADIDLTQLISAPNHFILTSDMDGLEAVETNDVTQSSYIEAQTLEQEMEATTVTRAAQGLPESGRLGRTASGARLIVGQSLEKFGTAIRLIEECAIKRALRMFHQLNLQFIDDDDILRDPGMYGHLFEEDMSPEMIRAEVKFKMVGISEMVNTEAKINQIASFLGLFKDALSPKTLTMIMKKVWKLMGFDSDEIGELQAVPPTNAPGVSPEIAGQPGSTTALTQAINNEVQQNGAQTVPSAIRQTPPTPTGG